MIEFRSCYPEHIMLVRPQPAQERGFYTGLAFGQERNCLRGPSYSGWVDHRCVGAAGLMLAGHKAVAWAVLAEACRDYMPNITAKVRGVIKSIPARRVEIVVHCDFEAGKRWAKLLGFQVEAERMRGYDPDGRDMALYAYVKD